jgi:hypothetical protein
MRDDANRVVPQGGGGGTHVRIAGATQHAAVGFVMHEAAPGEQVEVLTRAALTSDSGEFYTYIEQIPGIIGRETSLSTGIPRFNSWHYSTKTVPEIYT